MFSSRGPIPCSLLAIISLACLTLLMSSALAQGIPGAQPPERAKTVRQPVVPIERIRSIVDQEFPSLSDLYTSLHRSPELSLAEKQTARRLADELRKVGTFKVAEAVGGHGVVAVMENGKGKTLLIRSDLDALPVKEQ